MPEVDSTKEQKQFYEKIPMETPGFFLKGAGSLDWGMKNRLARIFSPDSGRTVMLAIDHGYFQGPTTGLERIDLTIVPMMYHADAVMLTRGILRTTVPATLKILSFIILLPQKYRIIFSLFFRLHIQRRQALYCLI